MYDGYVFFCNQTSQQQCLSTKHYSCAENQPKPKGEIKEGSVIFLYNPDEKTLLGPFTALTEGATELDAGTWRMDVDTHIPSEDIKVTWENLHLIKNAPAELPFLENPKTCRLSTSETQQLLDLLKQGEPYLAVEQES
jgi:hypothetical protein